MELNGAGPLPQIIFGLSTLNKNSLVTTTVMNCTPQADGAFVTNLIEGDWQVVEVRGLPPGFSITALNYGTVDLSRNPLKIRLSDLNTLFLKLTRSESQTNR